MSESWHPSQWVKDNKVCSLDQKPCDKQIEKGFYNPYFKCRNYIIGMGYWWLSSSAPCYEKEKVLITIYGDKSAPPTMEHPLPQVIFKKETELNLIKNKRDEQLVVHYIMLTRQLTHLSDCLLHIIRLPTQENGMHGSQNLDYKGYRAYIQTEIADILVQAGKLLETLDLPFQETLAMGLTRDLEKQEEYLRKHPNDKWI